MNRLSNCVAVVTGAGSGIGRELSRQLASQGARIAISDIDAAGLAETVRLIDDSNAEIHHQVLDVADEQTVFSYAQDVRRHFGEVNLVINNAGVGLAGGNLWETPMKDFKWLFGINFFGVLYGTKAFLPILREARWGHIVNISSIFGIISVPQQTAYNASKFAVRGMTDALRQELELDGSSVSCTTVHPGGIKTNIARSARVSEVSQLQDPQERETAINDFDKLARTTADSAARQILKAVEKNKRRLLIGADAKLMDILQRIFPNSYQHILQRVIGADKR
jgi:NAD(P)-dependent dehydrogenase (short-subunit alcohol dehydrogenase family)